MGKRRLTEGTVSLIRDYLKANMAQALADTRADRVSANDKNVFTTTEPPNSYFIYPRAKGYRPPAVFVIAPTFDKKKERGANFIDATVRVNVSILVEDRDRETLQIKSWRYQSALDELLDQYQLTSSDGKIKLTIIVNSISETPMYTDAKEEDSPDAVFRKETVLECDVEHYENF